MGKGGINTCICNGYCANSTGSPDLYYPPPNQIVPGFTYDAPGSCMTPTASSSSANACYPNGEFNNAGPGTYTDCCYSDNNDGLDYNNGTCCGCSGSNCLFSAGKRIKCAFNGNYTANPTQCAIGYTEGNLYQGHSIAVSNTSKTFIPGLNNVLPPMYHTCDPSYLGGSNYNTTMSAYCSSSNNMYNSTCQKWCANNISGCASTIGTFCAGNNLNSAICQTYCSNQSIYSNCTNNIASFCQGQNLNLPACKFYCFNSTTKFDCDKATTTFCAPTANQKLDICPCFLPVSVYTNYYIMYLVKLIFQQQLQLN